MRFITVLLATSYYFSNCNAWPIAFKKTSKSVPSIEVKLSPPEDPLPQVSASIQMIEKERMKVEEALMSKLEDVFNKMLDEAQLQIKESVDRSMKVFEDRNMLDNTVLGSLLPLLSPSKEAMKMRSSFPAYRQRLPRQESKSKLSPTVSRTVGSSSTPPTENIKLDLRVLQSKQNLKASEKENPGTDSFSNHTLSDHTNPAERAARETTTDSETSQPASQEAILNSLQSAASFVKTRPTVQDGSTAIEAHPEGFTEKLNRDVATKPNLRNGPLTVPISFLQIQTHESLKQIPSAAKDAVTNVLNKLSNVAAPVVNVEVVDLFEPDSSIEDKIKEIEQKRNDEEGKMFQMAADELEQLTKITIQELDKNIQLQMNPFLVDYESVSSALAAKLQKYSLPGGTPVGPTKFRQVHPHDDQTRSTSQGLKQLAHRRNSCLSIARRFPYLHIHCHPRIASFMQIKAKAKSLLTEQAGDEFLNPEQLNVKVGASDRPYPTIDELVDDMEKKRDATERLERAKILELQLRLMRAQVEMIKDALHTGIARVLALIGKTAESIKVEMVGGLVAEKQ